MQSKGPGGAGPQLPEQVPDGVQNLIDGIFSFGGDLGKGFGEFVSGLGEAINGGQAMLGPDTAGTVLDAAVMLV